MILFYFLVLLMPFLYPPFLSRIISADVAFKVVGLACLPYALYRIASRGGFPAYFRTWQARLFVLFYAIAAISHVRNILEWHFFSSTFTTLTSFLVLFFITLAVVDSLPRLRGVLFAASVAVALGSVRVIEEYLRTGERAGMTVGDSNYFATSAVLVVPVALLMVMHNKKRWERLGYGACLAVSLVGITVCASRGGFLALAAASMYLLSQFRHRIRNLLLIGLVVVPLLLFLPVSPLQRFLHPTYSDRESTAFHLLAWKAGLGMINAHPLFGVGLGRFKPMMPFYEPGLALYAPGVKSIGHNSYLEVAAELGLPTLGVFVGILFFSCRSLGRARKRARQARNRPLYCTALGLQAGLVGYMVGAASISAEYQKLLWLAIMLSICLPSFVRVRISEDSGPETTRSGHDLTHADAEFAEKEFAFFGNC